MDAVSFHHSWLCEDFGGNERIPFATHLVMPIARYTRVDRRHLFCGSAIKLFGERANSRPRLAAFGERLCPGSKCCGGRNESLALWCNGA